MVSFSSTSLMGFMLSLMLSSLFVPSRANFYQDFDITWGDGRGKILNNGDLLTLSLDKASGSGVQSKNEYLFGKFDMQLKLIPGNSAGTVTTFYVSSIIDGVVLMLSERNKIRIDINRAKTLLKSFVLIRDVHKNLIEGLSSQGTTHDELDFEFLGNLSGDPYILQTNVYTQGKGDKEQQFYPWFDPTVAFHTYSIHWNPQRIIFFVDGIPIREFKNAESIGAPYLNHQAMRIYATLWDGDNWATRGGRVKTDWTQAPFTASYANFRANACIWSSGISSCGSVSSSSGNNSWLNEDLDATGRGRLQQVQKYFMIYNYCTDAKRFPQGFPPECAINP
ncbi:hypothetical protein LguiB_010603 [Lonicera macranthoides]